MLDAYETLQVSRNAEPEVIEAAFRRLARKYHPDTNPASDATARMQEINWAYEILRDPTKRAQYDRATHPPQPRAPRARTQEAPTPRPPSTQTATARNTARPAPARSSVGPASKSERTFLQKYWFAMAVAVAAYLLLAQSRQGSVQPGARSSDTGESSLGSATLEQDPYRDCIDWRSTDLYDGQTKCVIGRILMVTHEFDNLSGADIWTGLFGFDKESDFRLVSVDKDISRWQDQCVVVYGTIFDRDLLRDYVEAVPAPSMVDSDPLDDRGFTITLAPAGYCD